MPETRRRRRRRRRRPTFSFQTPDLPSPNGGNAPCLELARSSLVHTLPHTHTHTLSLCCSAASMAPQKRGPASSRRTQNTQPTITQPGIQRFFNNNSCNKNASVSSDPPLNTAEPAASQSLTPPPIQGSKIMSSFLFGLPSVVVYISSQLT